MSVINTNNSIDYTKSVQFFDQQLNLQRYDQYRYPVLHQLYKTQKSYFWSPTEISLQKDKIDYSKLTEQEKFIYTSNLKYQILLDSVQSRSTLLAFLPFVTLPELEKNIIIWGFFETIHSESYTHIIENVYNKPSEIFDNILNIPEILERTKQVTKYYDEFIELSSSWNASSLKELCLDNNVTANQTLLELKRSLYLAIVNVNILEGIRFYTSFACSFAFAENTKMIGSSDIISLIARDEACYTTGHEALTESGWKLIEDITTEDKVAQYTETNAVQFVHPTATIKKAYVGEVYQFVDNTGRIEQIVTEDHRMVWRELSTGRMRESLAAETCFNTNKAIVVSGIVIDGIVELNPLEILNVYFEYCGTVLEVLEHKLKVEFVLRDVATWNKLAKSLATLGIDYEFKIIYKTGLYVINCEIPTITLQKYFSWIDITGKSSVWAQNLINLCRILDNQKSCISAIPNKFKFGINHTKSLKKLQEVFTISNWKIYHTKPVKKYFGYTIKVITDKNTHTTTSTDKIKQQYSGNVYCLSVPSGAFFVRYNDKVSVGGNCHTRLTETIIKNWQAGEDKDFLDITKEEESAVYSMFELAVQAEMDWAKYLFKNGSILGLNVELLSQYIKFIANRRLKAINMKPLYDVSIKNPLPWIDNYLKSSNISVAPMESEILSYVIGNVNKDIADDQFSNFEL